MSTVIFSHPILFTGEMVRAILDGRKTQTRRVVKPQPQFGLREYRTKHMKSPAWGRLLSANTTAIAADGIRCPYGVPGDRLWVREAVAEWTYLDGRIGGLTPRVYCDDPEWAGVCDDARRGPPKWFAISNNMGWYRLRNARFMPRWASRITLEVTGVRVERVQSISEEDAIAEGIRHTGDRIQDGSRCSGATSVRGVYAALWDRINGKKHPWASNPWVWVIEFAQKEHPP